MAEEDPGNKLRKRGEEVPPGGGGDGDTDLLSRLPPTRFLAASSRSSPPSMAPAPRSSRAGGAPSGALRLSTSRPISASFAARLLSAIMVSTLCEVLNTHEAPVRRFSISHFISHIVDPLIQSPRLQGVQEFELFVLREIPSLPQFSHALSALHIWSDFEFPTLSDSTLSFPRLKHLTLKLVQTSERAFRGLLSRCPVLETLLLDNINGGSRVRISSPSLRSVGVCDNGGLKEIMIIKAPLLERLIPRVPRDHLVIRIIHAPRLRTLGYLHDDIPGLQLGTLYFKKMVLVRPSDAMRSVRSLGLLTAPNLDFVTGLLKCFPCVEKLHIVSSSQSYTRMIFKNNMKCYDPLECLDRHLKKLRIINYEEKRPDVNFIKFFVLNARVLESMKFVVCRDKCGAKWIARQHKKLQVNDRASQGAVFDFEADCSRGASSMVDMNHIHDLDMAPLFKFDRSLCKCHGDVFDWLF